MSDSRGQIQGLGGAIKGQGPEVMPAKLKAVKESESDVGNIESYEGW